MTDTVSSNVVIEVQGIRRLFELEVADDVPDSAVMLLDWDGWNAPRAATPDLVKAILASPDQNFIAFLSQVIAPVSAAGRIMMYSDGVTLRMARPDGSTRSVELQRSDLDELLEANLSPDAELIVMHPSLADPKRLSFNRFSQWLALGVVPDKITSWTG